MTTKSGQDWDMIEEDKPATPTLSKTPALLTALYNLEDTQMFTPPRPNIPSGSIYKMAGGNPEDIACEFVTFNFGAGAYGSSYDNIQQESYVNSNGVQLLCGVDYKCETELLNILRGENVDDYIEGSFKRNLVNMIKRVSMQNVIINWECTSMCSPGFPNVDGFKQLMEYSGGLRVLSDFALKAYMKVYADELPFRLSTSTTCGISTFIFNPDAIADYPLPQLVAAGNMVERDDDGNATLNVNAAGCTVVLEFDSTFDMSKCRFNVEILAVATQFGKSFPMEKENKTIAIGTDDNDDDKKNLTGYPVCVLLTDNVNGTQIVLFTHHFRAITGFKARDDLTVPQMAEFTQAVSDPAGSAKMTAPLKTAWLSSPGGPTELTRGVTCDIAQKIIMASAPARSSRIRCNSAVTTSTLQKEKEKADEKIEINQFLNTDPTKQLPTFVPWITEKMTDVHNGLVDEMGE
jgi:hypothetical protein